MSLFFFTREPLFEFFFSNIKRILPQMLQISHKVYIFYYTGNKRSSALKTREHHRFISPSKEGCGVGTLSSVDTPSFEQNT